MLAAFGALAAARSSALTPTPYIDGISDQNMPEWDGNFSGSYFASFFKSAWVQDGHIRLARYVVQWNVMDGDYAPSRAKLETWLRDVKELGLLPNLGLTSYDGTYPASAAEYGAALVEILGQAELATGERIDYVEPWNEPNNQGHEPPAVAAGFANVAQAICPDYGCTIVAGDLEDSAGAGAYQLRYAKHLHPMPVIWGVHPYHSVQEMSTGPLRELDASLPPGGAGKQLWFTEVSARRCTDYGGHLRENGEAGQAQRVNWLIGTLMAYAKPEHVFYYTFLVSGRREPSCTRAEPEDEALYVPDADPNVPDAPRPAAAYASEGEPTPWTYTSSSLPPSTAPSALAGLVEDVAPLGLYNW